MSLPITFEYLGAAEVVPDGFSPTYGIRYNTQGFDKPRNWNHRSKKLRNKGVTEHAIAMLRAWDGSQIPAWVDQAWEHNRDLFTACSGSVGDKARQVRADRFKVVIEPSEFATPYSPNGYAAGIWLPHEREIHVVCIYPEADGWMRDAKDLLVWEFGNAFSTDCGIVPEDPHGPAGRPIGWPCSGPRS